MSESHLTESFSARGHSLARRSSRPTSLHISQPEESLDESSHKDSNLSPLTTTHDRTVTAPSTSSSPSPQTSPRPVRDDRSPMESPCFVHSHLDKGASLTEWLYNKQPLLTRDTNVGVSKSLQYTNGVFPREIPYPKGSITPPNISIVENDLDDEDGFAESLTKQLAETAVGVREMSKQLGQCLRLSLTA
jgi:NAD+ kinase